MSGSHQRNTRPMRQSPRCGARTRKGTACQAPAVAGKRRCRMHGGAVGFRRPDRQCERAEARNVYTRGHRRTACAPPPDARSECFSRKGPVVVSASCIALIVALRISVDELKSGRILALISLPVFVQLPMALLSLSMKPSAELGVTVRMVFVLLIVPTRVQKAKHLWHGSAEITAPWGCSMNFISEDYRILPNLLVPPLI